jgi:hypothetical protein
MIPEVFQVKSELKTTVTFSWFWTSDPRAIPGTSGSPTELVLTKATLNPELEATLLNCGGEYRRVDPVISFHPVMAEVTAGFHVDGTLLTM